MLKILFFSEPVFPLHPGGAGRSSFVYAAELVRRGHQVFLVCPGDVLCAEVIEGVRVHRVPCEWGPNIRNRRTEENATARGFLNYSRTHILPHGIDLVLDCGGFLSYFFTVIYEIRRQYQIPIIVYFHLLEDEPARDPIHFVNRLPLASLTDFDRGARQHPQCFAVRAADAVVCMTRHDADIVQRLYRPVRMFVLPPPIDPNLCTAKGAPPPSNLGMEHLIVFAGRINDDSKGARIVAKAIKQVLAVRSDIRLIVIGNATETDFSDLGSHVNRVGWVNDSATLCGWLGAADMLLMPSRFETFGMMCAEALFMGLPVIGSPVGGLPNMVTHGHNGYLLKAHHPQGWPKEISNYILHLLQNPSLLARMKRNAASGVADLDVSSLGRRLEQICLETVEKRHESHALRMPALNSQLRVEYLVVLSQLGGRQARHSGEALLPLLGEESEARCRACCRRGIFSNVHRVAKLAKGNGPQTATRLRRAVFSTCPWSLVALKEQERIAKAIGSIRSIDLWLWRIFFFVARRLRR